MSIRFRAILIVMLGAFGAANAQVSGQTTAILETVKDRVFHCGDYHSMYVYRPGQGETGWFLLSHAGPDDGWSLTEDLRISGSSGTPSMGEVQYRSFFDDGRNDTFRLRVSGESGIKILSSGFVTDRCSFAPSVSRGTFLSWW